MSVGHAPDRDGTGGTSCYDNVSCPNCGCTQIPLGQAAETRGDHVLVNKLIYNLRGRAVGRLSSSGVLAKFI